MRSSPTPPPDPTPTPPDQITGASLTLCHFTGPDTGYVAVTITADKYSGYFDDKDDIIPAPSTGCDNIDPATAGSASVTVCHLNANGTYTLLHYPPGDLGGHEGDKGDLIPAPNGACPGVTTVATPVPTVASTPIPSPTSEPDTDVIAAVTAAPKRTPRPRATAVPVATASAVESGATTPTADELPFTGLDLGLIAGLGLAFVLMGAGLRLVAPAARWC